MWSYYPLFKCKGGEKLEAEELDTSGGIVNRRKQQRPKNKNTGEGLVSPVR